MIRLAGVLVAIGICALIALLAGAAHHNDGQVWAGVARVERGMR